MTAWRLALGSLKAPRRESVESSQEIGFATFELEMAGLSDIVALRYTFSLGEFSAVESGAEQNSVRTSL